MASYKTCDALRNITYVVVTQPVSVEKLQKNMTVAQRPRKTNFAQITGCMSRHVNEKKSNFPLHVTM